MDKIPLSICPATGEVNMERDSTGSNVYTTINGDFMESDDADPMDSPVYKYPDLPPGREDLKPIKELKPVAVVRPLDDDIYIQIIPGDEPGTTITEIDGYTVPDYKRGANNRSRVYATLETDPPLKDKPKSLYKRPAWWVWVLILLGVCILCTLIILVVIFLRGPPKVDPAEATGQPTPQPTNIPIGASPTSYEITFMVPSNQHYPPIGGHTSPGKQTSTTTYISSTTLSTTSSQTSSTTTKYTSTTSAITPTTKPTTTTTTTRAIESETSSAASIPVIETTSVKSTTTTASIEVTSASTNEVVSPLRVSEGPLSAKSFCEFKLNEHKNRKLHSSRNAIRQPSTIDTKAKCRQACLGAGGDALLPSGETCMAAAFNSLTNECFLTNSIPGSERADGWVYIQVEYYCYPASAPGCNYRFRKTNNRRLVDDKDKNIVQPFDVPSVPACADGCAFLSESNSSVRCQGFTFDRSTNSCTLYTTMKYGAKAQITEEMGTDIYKTAGRACVNCGDLYPTRTADQATVGGILQEGNFANTQKCKRRCDDYQRSPMSNGSICYGFDYNNREKTCHISSTRQYTLAPKRNTDNVRRDIICYDCSDPTKYISTVDTSSVGGRVYQSASFDSPYWCGYLCQGQSVGYNAPTCYGFSFNHTTKACTLYHQFDFELGTIGGSPGMDTYRRLYKCMSPTSCKETYTKTSNAASSSRGIVQPKDINTIHRCMDRCWGYGVATSDVCYGVDFNRGTKTCIVHTTEGYTISASDGVDSFRRNMNCKLPY